MSAFTQTGLPEKPRTAWGLRGFLVCIAALVFASFWTLNLQWRAFLEPSAARIFGEFLAGFWPPDFSHEFLRKLTAALFETLAMSVVGTLLAAATGLALAYAAQGGVVLRMAARGSMNVLRSIPELVWASLLIVAAGLGPLAGTLALALHTAGVLARLFADALENAPQHASAALRANGATRWQAFCYAGLPQTLPQLLSYVLYRWENNIRAAAVLGVVGAGGLGQMLKFYLSLFQMQAAASVILAMLVLVLCVDGFSFWARKKLS